MNNGAVVVVGASQGLGESLCEVFQMHGKRVVGASRNVSRLRELELRLPGIHTYACDVRNLEEMHSLMEYSNTQFGGMSVLILSFGVNFDDLVVDWESTDGFRTVVETNLIGAANALHAALPYLKRNKTSQVVVLTSLAGVIGCVPGGSAYAASKAGLDAMFTSCAPELKSLGISVLIVDPGSMESNQARQVVGSGTRYRDARANRAKRGKPTAKVAEQIYQAVNAKRSGRMWSTFRIFVLGALAIKLFLPSLMTKLALRVRFKNGGGTMMQPKRREEDENSS